MVASPVFEESHEADEHARQKLLVVDDQESARRSLRIVFGDDYDVILCTGGAEALDLLSRSRIDVMILDLRMPGLSGIEVLKRVRALPNPPEVIILTAFETIETARSALRLGAFDYLTKPFDIAVIREAVADACERKRSTRMLRDHGRQLEELQQELLLHQFHEEMLRSRGEIYASILHDLNGPLTVINGFVEFTRQRLAQGPVLDGEDLEAVRDRIERVHRQVQNCLAIARRYLNFLRDSSTGTTSANQILEDLHELLNSHPDAQSHELDVHTLDEPWAVEANGTELIQILINLCLNAFQSGPSRVRVSVHPEVIRLPLRIRAIAADSKTSAAFLDRLDNVPPLLAFSVEDNGPGIDAALLPKIFEPYFTTKPVGKGNGLGLAIVKRLVEQAGGGIRLQTARGHGTTFTIFLRARFIDSGQA